MTSEDPASSDLRDTEIGQEFVTKIRCIHQPDDTIDCHNYVMKA